MPIVVATILVLAQVDASQGSEKIRNIGLPANFLRMSLTAPSSMGGHPLDLDAPPSVDISTQIPLHRYHYHPVGVQAVEQLTNRVLQPY